MQLKNNCIFFILQKFIQHMGFFYGRMKGGLQLKENLPNKDLAEKLKKNMVVKGYEKLAFGNIKDAVKLLFADDISPRSLARLDLFNVSEIKRPKGGGMEIKFFDRIKALQCLESLSEPENRASDFLEALQKGAENLAAESLQNEGEE